MNKRKTKEGSCSSIVSEKRVYTVDEIRAILGIGRNKAYALMKQGHFHCVRIGGRYRISKKSFDKWLNTKWEVQADE